MNKYSWFYNEKSDYTIRHTENDVETFIAIADTAEKADFITKACNQFNLEQYEAKNISLNPDVSGQFSHTDMVAFANYMITHDQMASKAHIDRWLNLR